MIDSPENRKSMRQLIHTFFFCSVGRVYTSRILHDMFGSAFRTRVSEINRNRSSRIRIINSMETGNSRYWAERRK